MADAETGTQTVAVIVPVHRPGEDSARCLQSIRMAEPPPDELIVVLDGEAEQAEQLAKRFGVRVLATGGSRGPACARNLGASAATTDLLLFVDSDVLVPPSTVAQVTQFFGNHPEISAAIGSYDDAPGAPNFLSQYKNLFHHYVHQRAREEGYTFWGACGAIRRHVFLEVGGYHEGYRRASIEDIELGYRLKAAGHRIQVRRNLQVKHLKRWSPLSLLKTDFFLRALPWTRLILRTGRLENDLNIDWSSRFKVGLIGCIVGLLGLAWLWPWSLALAGLCGLTLLILDVPLLRFFAQKRGWRFALGTIPWHWFYYLYSGLGFLFGLVQHLATRGRDNGER